MAVWNPNVPPTSQLDLEEIKGLLETTLSNIQAQLHELCAFEENNCLDQLPREKLEQTKKFLIQALTDKVTPQFPDFDRSGELLFKSVLEKLEMQLKETTRMIDSEKCVLNKLNKKLKSLQVQCESFDTMTTARLESGEMKQAENLDETEKHLKAELRKQKRTLRYVIETIYPGRDDMLEIIERLLQSYTDNPSDYIELSNEEWGKISRFFDVGIITRHPYHPMKVRLC